MRTRIALVAIIPVALITVSTLMQAASVQPARAVTTRSSATSTSTPSVMPAHQLTAYTRHAPGTLARERSGASFGLASLLLHGHPLGAKSTVLSAASVAPPSTTTTASPVAAAAPALQTPAPALTAPATGPVDTVTPTQRAEWERVAMCEEGGNWSANGSMYSGGLGINRSNWSAYGGQQFAPEGAMATEDQQIMVAERIQFNPPDQGGCHGW